MKTQVWKKAIINTLAATGSNVGLSTATGGLPAMVYICSNDVSTGTASYTIDATVSEILPPFPADKVQFITKQYSAAEVRQLLLFGLDTETIIASQRYTIKIGNMFERYEGETKKVPVNYSYTAPAVLSGVAATDLTNVYTVLAAKINASTTNTVTAYLMYKVAFTGGTDSGSTTTKMTPGETLTQETSGITMKVAGHTISSGTFVGDNAAGTIYLYDFSAIGSWSTASKTLTGGTSTLVVTTNAALTCQGLVILDDAGYYPYNPSVRRGPSWVGQDGWNSAHVKQIDTTAATMYGRAGVISVGIGSRLFQDLPYFNADKTDYSQGNPGFILNANPDVTKTYTRVDIHLAPGQVEQVLEGNQVISQFVYTIWIEEDGGLTNNAAFLAALAATTGKTPA